jgi:hypothetical protein
LDDNAADPISAIGDVGPFTGRWRPDEPLAAVNGQPIPGTWRLRVQDLGFVDSGILDAWSLEVRELMAECQPFGVQGVTVSPASAVAGALPGGLRLYAFQVENTGAVADTYTVTLGPHAWPIGHPALVGPLAPGMQAAFGVTVTVPMTAAVGATDAAAVSLTSHADPAVGATAHLHTTAIAPTHFVLLPALLSSLLSSP